jgi:glycosyltransferase 2 family protein
MTAAVAMSGRRATLRAALPYVVGIAITALAAALLIHTLSGYPVADIKKAIVAISAADIGLAALFVAASYLCLTFFDYLALHYIGHSLPYYRAAWASFTALSLGHNIGFAGASSGAIRYRFYARSGLGLGDVARLVVFCGVTVALGLATLGGLALIIQPRIAQSLSGLPAGAVMWLGVALLALPCIYTLLCATLAGSIRIARWELPLPEPRLALAQIALGTLNYLLVAGALYAVLRRAPNADYFATASAYVIGNVTAIVSHIPGGVGVLEAVVGYLMPGAAIIGGLVMFRTMYYLVPLAFGLVSFAIAEFLAMRRATKPHS